MAQRGILAGWVTVMALWSGTASAAGPADAAAGGTGAAPAAAAKRRPMKVDDLFRLPRVGDAQVSPDGKRVVYALGEVLVAENRVRSNLWIVPADGSAPPRRLTTADKKDLHPRFSPDGRRILFESNRSGSMQLYVLDLDAGGEARQLTNLSTEAGTGVWSPDGKLVAFVSAVHPEFSALPPAEAEAANRKRLDEVAKSPVKARVASRLFFRHWDSYVEGRRQHLFVVPADGGEPRDVTPGDRDAYPTSTTFSVGDDFTFTPDSKSLAFTAVPAKEEAWSTDFDICSVPVTGGTADWEILVSGNTAADGAPAYSPDGKFLAWRAQAKPGYEADRWTLMVAPVDGTGKPTAPGKPRDLGADLSVEEFAWAAGGGMLFLAEQGGTKSLFRLPADGKAAKVARRGSLGNLSVAADGKRIAFTLATMNAPYEAFSAPEPDAAAADLSKAAAAVLAELDLPEPTSVTVTGAGGTPMQMWILKPPGFDPARKWPLAFLVHGGPQSAWADGWSNRWNPQVWAAQGYVVAMPNPRGSTGFGQKYTDEISGDWGGKCYDDLMAGLAHLEAMPCIDKDRMFSAGASFGGYMMNWFQAKTRKFKTLVTHCGVYNFDSMYATTEELWFDEYEHGGPPWGNNRESYEKHSPHRYAKDFATPMLIIHNDLDFRVPISEGLQLFTTLQRLGIESRYVNFPDEGHWVLKPANSRFWHEEIFGWVTKRCPPGPR